MVFVNGVDVCEKWTYFINGANSRKIFSCALIFVE